MNIRTIEKYNQSGMKRVFLDGLLLGNQFVSHGNCLWVSDSEEPGHVPSDSLYEELARHGVVDDGYV